MKEPTFNKLEDMIEESKTNNLDTMMQDIHSKQKDIGIETWRQKANEFSVALSNSDSRFDGSVSITISDGSDLRLRHAFAAIVNDYVIVFTQHVGMLFFQKENVSAGNYDYIEEWKIDEKGELIIPGLDK